MMHVLHCKTDLPVFLLQVLLQLGWFREINRIPGKVPLPICVLNIQPDDIVRNTVAIKSSIHRLHVSFINVVPAALVVPEGKQRGQGLIS